MKRIYQTERVTFRVMDVHAEMLPALHAAARGCEFTASEGKKRGRLAVFIGLKNSEPCARLCKFVLKHKLRQTKYGLSISLVTERHSDGLRVPEFAIRMVRRIGGQLDFRFTTIKPKH